MGIQLVAHVTTYVSPALPRADAAVRVLYMMASKAHDADATPAYFGGSDYLAARLGYGHTCTSGACTRRRNGKPRESCDPAGERRVRKILRALVDAGVIAQAADPDTGDLINSRNHVRRWHLLVDRWPHLSQTRGPNSPVETPSREDRTVLWKFPAERTEQSPRERTEQSPRTPDEGTERSPRERTERSSPEEQREEQLQPEPREEQPRVGAGPGIARAALAAAAEDRVRS